jgi:alanine racemase
LDNLSVVVKYKLIPSISSAQGVIELIRLGARLKKTMPFHLKVDTGMGRIGITAQSAQALLKKIRGRKEIAMAGMYTHFSSADSNRAYTRMQFFKFMEVVKAARKLGMNFSAHCANSAALLKYPQMQLDMVRPGIALYGLSPWQKTDKKLGLRPVLMWKTAIVFLKNVKKGAAISYGRAYIAKKPMAIATLPVGYADGYSRLLSNKADVLVRGRRCRVVGRVTMDMMMVDVTRVPNASIGDEVVLVGAQGKERIRIEDLAADIGAISYEVACSISHRVPRIET